MDSQTISKLYLKREKERNKGGWNNRGNDLFKEASDKRCFVHYERPNWVTDEYSEAIDYLISQDFESLKAIKNSTEELRRQKLSEQYRKNRESYLKREKAKVEKGKEWKNIIKPGDVVIVKKSGRNCPILIVELDEFSFLGRYLRYVNKNGVRVLDKTDNYTPKSYKFIVSQILNPQFEIE